VSRGSLTAEPAQTQANFDRHFLDAIGEVIRVVASLSPETTFSFGRAQKILTIYLKYAYGDCRVSSQASATVLHAAGGDRHAVLFGSEVEAVPSAARVARHDAGNELATVLPHSGG